MRVIDDEGRLFGTVNIIDALVVLFVLAVVVAGVALVTGGGGSTSSPGTGDAGPSPTRTVVVDIGQQPDYIIDAIPEGPVETDSVVAVENMSVTETTNQSRVRLTVTLPVSENDDGLLLYKNERLYVGRDVTLDLRTTIVSGTVVEIR